jgi:hypothetical protein
MERSGIAAHIKDPANRRIITQLCKLMPVFDQATARAKRRLRSIKMTVS